MLIISKKNSISYELGKNSEWIQFFWDSGSRSTVALSEFTAAAWKDDMETMSVFNLDCYKLVLGENSEETIESIIDVTEEVKENLFRLVITHMKNYPDEPHEINPPENLI